MYSHTENEAASLRLQNVELEQYENMSQGQRSKSKCRKLRMSLSGIVTAIPIKPQQFLASSLWVARYRFFAGVTLTMKVASASEVTALRRYTNLFIIIIIIIRKVYLKLEKYKNRSQGQRIRSNITDFQQHLAFTMERIATKLRRFDQ